MKLVSLRGTPDGRLALADPDLRRAVVVADVAASLQDALERWDSVEPELRSRADDLAAGAAPGSFPLDHGELLAPLPRAWQWLDGSAFPSHAELMSMAFGIEPVSDGSPLMYQGLSDRFYAPRADIPFSDESDDIDFEAEFGVIVSAVPKGVTAPEAGTYVRLVVLINDWSLRSIAPAEMRSGFGFVQAKPASGLAPAAVTPDELGDAWRDSRVCVNLTVRRNGEEFGAANGREMAFGFDELIAHAARTRDLVAGTIIGSGTVSNSAYRDVGSSCITERRMIEQLDRGAPETPFMRFGERVQMEARGADGRSVFGLLDQRVTRG